jgi:hypothetical protein
MWEPRRLTTLWASTACYRDSLTLAVQLARMNEELNYHHHHHTIKSGVPQGSTLELLSMNAYINNIFSSIHNSISCLSKTSKYVIGLRMLRIVSSCIVI